MTYRLQAGETVAEGVRRCATEQLSSAIAELSTATGNPVSAVHSARKSVKKNRSLLRLMRGGLEGRQRRSENDALRAVARTLGEIRDRDVLLQTLDELADRFAGQVPQASFEAIREAIPASGSGAGSFEDRAPPIGEAVDDLRAGLRRAEEWRLHDDGWSALRAGLIRGYRRGRRAFRAARSKPTAANIHEWRKRVKDLWYHTRLLRSAAPDILRGQAKEAHRLSDILGDDHDLSMLREALLSADPGIPADVDAVLGLIEYRRRELQVEAFLLGERLYAEPPKAFARRMKRYWKAWRAETKTAHSRPPAELAQLVRG